MEILIDAQRNTFLIMEEQEFKCSEDAKHHICKIFSLKKGFVDSLTDEYTNLIREIPYQYLAHIIRTMEVYIRNISEDWQFFRITCSPTNESSDFLKELACATYQKFDSFDIVYDKDMTPLQKRVCIAHELGHLFLVVMTDRDYGDNHEPLSTLYGILTMLHKQQFQNKDKKHKSEQDVIADFSQMFNRINGKPNISS